MNSLATRVVSGVVALFILIGLVYFLGDKGLKLLCCLAPVLAQRELSRLLFTSNDSRFIRWSFSAFVLAIFAVSAMQPGYSGLILSVGLILFCSLILSYENLFKEMDDITSFLAKSFLGIFYVGLLPAIAFQLIELPQGNFWFLTMLAAVLFGDTFAYVFGLSFGKRKLSPRLSPKKTVEGSLGGLFGSAVAGLISSVYFLTTVNMLALVFLCILTGFVAQQGDLFESLLKRVANRKDSGSIMPGHGGLLDRIDGILFGAPVMMGGALLLLGFN